MDFGKRLSELRSELGLSQADLAKALGLAASTISMYEVGKREPDFETEEAIADYFNVDLNYLRGKQGQKVGRKSIFDYENIMPLPKTYKVPLIGDIACGSPILAEENINDYIEISEEIQADFCLRCHGDSMINARIFDGDIVFVRQQSDVDDGQIAVVIIEENATLKRVYHYQNELQLRAENPTFPMIIKRGEELNEVCIQGLAVAFLSNVR